MMEQRRRKSCPCNFFVLLLHSSQFSSGGSMFNLFSLFGSSTIYVINKTSRRDQDKDMKNSSFVHLFSSFLRLLYETAKIRRFHVCKKTKNYPSCAIAYEKCSNEIKSIFYLHQANVERGGRQNERKRAKIMKIELFFNVANACHANAQKVGGKLKKLTKNNAKMWKCTLSTLQIGKKNEFVILLQHTKNFQI